MTTWASAMMPFEGEADDWAPIVQAARRAQIVLVGDATHGTHDFYRQRAQLTKRLISELGFAGIAVEGDWPDAWRVNGFVRGRSGDDDAAEALGDFRHFPRWRWRNADVLDFVGWLRAYNDDHPEAQVGWYGLDRYSLHASMHALLAYLKRVDPEAEERVRYGGFESLGRLGLREDDAVEVLLELQRRRPLSDEEERFAALQNAGAERYYRALLRDGSWNLRETHLADTLDALVRHLRGKVVVWAHNSHVGDARATRMGSVSLGQLCRQRREQLGGLGGGVILVGFTTYRGTVSAASSWDGPVERKQVRPAHPGSYEELFHDTGVERFLVDLRMLDDDEPRLERSIGAIYRPETEHYFAAVLPRQLDFVLHFDETRAVEPLERAGPWEAGELSETHPMP